MSDEDEGLTPLITRTRTALWMLSGYVFSFVAVAGCVAFTASSAISAVQAAQALLLAVGLLSLVWFDAREYRLPDMITLPLILAGIAFAFTPDGEGGVQSVLAAMISYGVVWILHELSFRLRGRPGIGLGDAKLLAAGGAWCGLEAVPWLFMSASFLGLCIILSVSVLQRRFKEVNRLYLPFGLAIAPAIWVIFLLSLIKFV